jgi:hypothetical protein
MKRSLTAGFLKALATLLLSGACAACAGVYSQASSSGDSSSGDSASSSNHLPEGNRSDVSGEALEQRNRDIVQSVTGRAM